MVSSFVGLILDETLSGSRPAKPPPPPEWLRSSGVGQVNENWFDSSAGSPCTSLYGREQYEYLAKNSGFTDSWRGFSKAADFCSGGGGGSGSVS